MAERVPASRRGRTQPKKEFVPLFERVFGKGFEGKIANVEKQLAAAGAGRNEINNALLSMINPNASQEDKQEAANLLNTKQLKGLAQFDAGTSTIQPEAPIQEGLGATPIIPTSPKSNGLAGAIDTPKAQYTVEAPTAFDANFGAGHNQVTVRMPDGSIKAMSGEELGKLMESGKYGGISKAGSDIRMSDKEWMTDLYQTAGYQHLRPGWSWQAGENNSWSVYSPDDERPAATSPTREEIEAEIKRKQSIMGSLPITK